MNKNEVLKMTDDGTPYFQQKMSVKIFPLYGDNSSTGDIHSWQEYNNISIVRSYHVKVSNPCIKDYIVIEYIDLGEDTK